MAFKTIGSLDPHGGPVVRKAIVANSVTITEEDSVKASSGFVALGTAGALVLGHVESIVTYDGVGVEDNGAGGDFVGTYTTASDNQTNAKVSVLVNVSKLYTYSVDPDDTIGTTTGSDLLGYHTDLADEDNTDESTATTGTAQYFIWGVDPMDSGNQEVSIYESQVFGV
ncbi:hypothetical protein DRN43_04670 [Thermococci archaeon]|nr:MAG: hypothetical protein DRN43_04670 [Thermococci archaeon]